MKKATRGTLETTRMLTSEQMTAYVGLGRTRGREFCDRIGATVRFTDRIVRFDRIIIDSALDKMSRAAVENETA